MRPQQSANSKMEDTHPSRFGCLTLTDKLPSSPTLYRRNRNVLRVTSYVPSDQPFFRFVGKAHLRADSRACDSTRRGKENKGGRNGATVAHPRIQGVPAKIDRGRRRASHNLCCPVVVRPLCERDTKNSDLRSRSLCRSRRERTVRMIRCGGKKVGGQPSLPPSPTSSMPCLRRKSPRGPKVRWDISLVVGSH
jgi:hypothetical protein